MSEPIEVVQDLLVLEVVEDGDDVNVDLFGGPALACASVRFTFADAVERARNVGRLKRWCHEGRAVTLTTTPSTVRLEDPARTLGEQLP